MGTWIHLVCALYTPNISFFDPERETEKYVISHTFVLFTNPEMKDLLLNFLLARGQKLGEVGGGGYLQSLM